MAQSPLPPRIPWFLTLAKELAFWGRAWGQKLSACQVPLTEIGQFFLGINAYPVLKSFAFACLQAGETAEDLYNMNADEELMNLEGGAGQSAKEILLAALAQANDRLASNDLETVWIPDLPDEVSRGRSRYIAFKVCFLASL